jgi:predicted outer membrane repeat protein
MNFREFEELLKSSKGKITLTEDVILDDLEAKDYWKGIEVLTDELIIDGNGHAVNGKKRASLLSIKDCRVTLKNMVFKNGCFELSGGAITNAGDLTVENCRFLDNSSDYYGGAIYNDSKLTIRESVFKANRADYGGAIYIDSDSTLNLDGSVFESNTSEFEGGAIYNKEKLLVYGSSFNRNASFKGGAIYNGGILNLKSCEFKDNIASDGDHIESENDENLGIYDCNFID